MEINFCPNRKQMRKEVEQCRAMGRLDVLTSICKCCVYKIFDESTLVSQCFTCAMKIPGTQSLQPDLAGEIKEAW